MRPSNKKQENNQSKVLTVKHSEDCQITIVGVSNDNLKVGPVIIHSI